MRPGTSGIIAFGLPLTTVRFYSFRSTPIRSDATCFFASGNRFTPSHRLASFCGGRHFLRLFVVIVCHSLMASGVGVCARDFLFQYMYRVVIYDVNGGRALETDLSRNTHLRSTVSAVLSRFGRRAPLPDSRWGEIWDQSARQISVNPIYLPCDEPLSQTTPATCHYMGSHCPSDGSRKSQRFSGRAHSHRRALQADGMGDTISFFQLRTMDGDEQAVIMLIIRNRGPRSPSEIPQGAHESKVLQASAHARCSLRPSSLINTSKI
jgi:hypothetical protein